MRSSPPTTEMTTIGHLADTHYSGSAECGGATRNSLTTASLSTELSSAEGSLVELIQVADGDDRLRQQMSVDPCRTNGGQTELAIYRYLPYGYTASSHSYPLERYQHMQPIHLLDETTVDNGRRGLPWQIPKPQLGSQRRLDHRFPVADHIRIPVLLGR